MKENKYYNELKTALTIRFVEERLLKLFMEGKLYGTVHTCIGQEFVGVSVGRAVSENDTIFSNHRCHGHFLSYKKDIVGLIGEIMGKAIGICGGRGGSQHIQLGNFYSNGVQGGILPIAAGLALAHKLQKSDAISIVFIGDGTLGEGIVYETLNIASKWNLPLLIICENNQYAQSTSISETLAGKISLRAEAFDIPFVSSDSWNWEELLIKMETSMNQIRTSSRPLFHLVETYRLMAHSKGDDYRSKEEILSFNNRDPLTKLFNTLKHNTQFKELLNEIENEIDEAVNIAEDAEYEHINVQQQQETKVTWETNTFLEERCVSSIRNILHESMKLYSNLLVLGEDIRSPYGGAFKCTQGLSDTYPDRVINTPISEQAIVGVGNGLAIGGFIPIIEIMFGDFITLAFDQWINHAAKFHFMYNEKINIPLIIRTPMGGKRGYGATHSQCLEKHFLGIPGTYVLCLNHRIDPSIIYRNLLANIDRPTLIIENKLLYSKVISSVNPNGFELLKSVEIFPTIRLKPNIQADITMVAIGGITIDAEQTVLDLSINEEIIVDLYMPTKLYPFDVGFLKESIKNTQSLIIVEEGQGFVALGSEIIAQVAEIFASDPLYLKRISAFPSHIPSSRPLEEDVLPGTEIIYREALQLFKRKENL